MIGQEVFARISEDACRALEAIVGPKHISTDPVICEAYVGRGMDKEIFWFRGVSRPPCAVISPKNAEQVARIVKTCNRYGVPYTPMTTFGLGITSPAYRDDIILIDLKRMDRMTLDDRNMYVILEPGVTFAQMHGETLKRGLIGCMPGGGGGTSPLVNTFVNGMGLFNYSITYCSQRRWNGIEWVSPEGDIYRLGSLVAGGESWHWQDAPGPNVSGLLHGISSWQGGMGIVTRISTKLYPFQPKKLEPQGMSYDTCVKMPEDRVRWYNISFAAEEDIRKTMREMGEARIGFVVNRVPAYWRDIGKSRGPRSYSNQFWELWDKAQKDKLSQRRVLRVCLVGRASPDQLKYEEQVLKDIVAENNGTFLSTRQVDEASFFAANNPGMWMATGSFGEGEGGMESPTCIRKARQMYMDGLKDHQHKSDYLDQKDETPWYMVFNGGRIHYSELHGWADGATIDPDDPAYDQGVANRMLHWRFSPAARIGVETGIQSFFPGMVQPVRQLAGAFQNYTVWVDRFKKEFDPKNVSAPGQPYVIDRMIDEMFPESFDKDVKKAVEDARLGPWKGNDQ